MAKKANPFVKKAAGKVAAKAKEAADKKEDAGDSKGGKKLPPWLTQNANGKVVAKGK
jgi:hypothetical protein